MAGHSKWANIKHRKGANDVKKGKVFGKIIKEILGAAVIYIHYTNNTRYDYSRDIVLVTSYCLLLFK